MISIPDTYVRQTEVAEEEAYLEDTQRAYVAGTLPWQVEQANAAAAAKAAKLSPTMVDALRSVAYCGDQATVKANTRRAIGSRGLVIGSQLTAAGWATLPATVAREALIVAYDQAVIEQNVRLAETRRWTMINLRMALAPADATWYGSRFAANARTEEDATLAHHQYGPWTGQNNAWHGIMTKIADEVNASNYQPSIERLGKIGAAFLASPTETRVVVDGLGFQIWTNYQPPFPVSDIELAEQAAYELCTKDTPLHDPTGCPECEPLEDESTQDTPRRPHNPNQDDPFAPFDTDDTHVHQPAGWVPTDDTERAVCDLPGGCGAPIIRTGYDQWDVTSTVPDKQCPICGHVAPQPRDADYVCTVCGATVLPNNAAVPAPQTAFAAPMSTSPLSDVTAPDAGQDVDWSEPLSELDRDAALDDEPRVTARIDGVDMPSVHQQARNAALADQRAAADRLGVPQNVQREYEASQATDWRDDRVPSACPLCGCEFVGPYRRVECQGCGAEVTPIPLTAAEWTGEGPEPVDVTNRVVNVDDAHSDALDIVSRYLAPMTSVADGHGNTGRVLRHNLSNDTVTVRMHRPSYTLPGQNYDRENIYGRDAVGTSADLWESIADIAKSQLGLHEPSLFWVSERWDGADDALCRYIPWRDHITDERSWTRLDVGDDDTYEYVRFVMLASYGDYAGSTVDASNYQWCKREWFDGMADPLLYEVGLSERDGLGIAVRIGDPRWNIARLAELESTVEGLISYPIIDEMHHSDYESALQDEWWSTNGLYDLKISIDNHFDSIVDSNGNPYTWETAVLASDLPYTTDDREELLAAVFFEAADYWDHDTATSATPHDVDSVTEFVISTVFADPNPRYPVWTGEQDVWLTATEISECAQPATDRNQLTFPLNGVSCERCGAGTTMLGNGTYGRHTNPTTQRRCHASGTKVSATL